ncbi:hypothetical protein C8R44DRAFT_875141 [Mycena epipterygia]|nr:hypothetical protein C8R44DRAFT_875141 [Mycena epipterygia]
MHLQFVKARLPKFVARRNQIYVYGLALAYNPQLVSFIELQMTWAKERDDEAHGEAPVQELVAIQMRVIRFALAAPLMLESFSVVAILFCTWLRGTIHFPGSIYTESRTECRLRFTTVTQDSAHKNVLVIVETVVPWC